MRGATMVAAGLLVLATACKPKTETGAASAATAIGEAEAAKLSDATVAAWTSTDAARIKALYAPGIVGFDLAAPALERDRATWDRNEDAFAAAKLDKSAQKARKIQILTPDIFVVSGAWDVASSTIPANAMTVRCTDVYQKDAGGKWLIVNEHCSTAPKG